MDAAKVADVRRPSAPAVVAEVVVGVAATDGGCGDADSSC
jgi:hypothetical protein